MNVLVAGGKSVSVEALPPGTSARDYISSKLDDVTIGGREGKDDAFYVFDLGRVIDLYDRWTAAMSGIQPFYAVKCNSDPALLKTLASLGAGFDCASKNEIKAVLDLGVPPDRIIYAHPCKQVSHLQFAATNGVKLMTFDNEFELYKVKSHFPTARLVLRITADDPTALLSLSGGKFGCSVSAGKELVTTASQLGLSVVGVSFHVGFHAQSAKAYTDAIEMAAEIFQHAKEVGYRMTLLDIGGGYPGEQGPKGIGLFGDMAEAVMKGIIDHFFDYSDLKVIAEPGRFFACSTHAIAVNIIAKRVSAPRFEKNEIVMMYHINEGTYGTLRHLPLFPRVVQVLKPLLESAQLYHSKIWGQTCSTFDIVCESVMLPELAIGDWLFAEEIGDYTVCVGSTFNGFSQPTVYHYTTGVNCDRLKQLCCSCKNGSDDGDSNQTHTA